MILKPNDPKIIEYIQKCNILKKPRGNQAGKRRVYKDIYAAFDIETTNIEYNGELLNFMYSWALQLNEDITIIGRDWQSFYDLKERIKEELKGVVIVVFIHNLKYEFQYLKPLGFTVENVLASEKREVIKCFSDPFEFRCSYKLTGVSLEKLTENVKHKKKSGEEFNYNKKRFPWTKLNDLELEYITNDVLGLVEAIKERNKIYGDSLYTMPITLTGYVRRLLRRRMRTVNRNQIEKTKINEDIYKMLAGAFRGGNTIANRYYLGEIIDDLAHFDMSSAYPAQIVFKNFPIADWQEVKNPDPGKLLKYIYKRKRAVLAKLLFNNIRLKKKDDPAPYIAENKILIRGKKQIANGRILQAEQIEIFVTDIDLDIILGQYEFESMAVLVMYKTRYGKLPPQLTEIIEELYIKKTELRGKDEIELKIAKELLNSTFGLMAQNPAKERIYYIDGKFEIGNAGVEANLEEFNKTAFLSYAFGVWVAAHCRADLQRMIKAAGDDFIYCDTDGIYLRNYEEHKKEIEKIIKYTESRGMAHCAIDTNGEYHYLGSWEEQPKIHKFIAAGQKKYAWEDNKGLHIATAGVNKDIGGKELGKIENYKEGFIFDAAGGNEAIYNDNPLVNEIFINNKKIEITPYIYIRPRRYKLGIYQEYKNILLYPEFWLKFTEDRGHKNNEYLFGK